MRVSNEHLMLLRQAITPLDNEAMRHDYRTGNFARSELVQDLDKRYRWDLFWIALDSMRGTRAHSDLCGYQNAHIDTALRLIVPALQPEPAPMFEVVGAAIYDAETDTLEAA